MNHLQIFPQGKAVFVLDQAYPVRFHSWTSAVELFPKQLERTTLPPPQASHSFRAPISTFLRLQHVAGALPPVGTQSVLLTSRATSGPLKPGPNTYTIE